MGIPFYTKMSSKILNNFKTFVGRVFVISWVWLKLVKYVNIVAVGKLHMIIHSFVWLN